MHIRPILRIAGFIASLGAIFFATVNVYRHFTWGFLEPYQATCARITLPSAVVALLAFVSLFFHKENMDAFLVTLGKKIMASSPWVIGLLLFSIGLLCGSLNLLYMHCPVKWQKFIDTHFVNGDQDSYAAARHEIEEAADFNKETAANLILCLSVFEKRVQVNHTHTWPSEGSVMLLAMKTEKLAATSDGPAGLFLKFTAGAAWSLAADLEVKMDPSKDSSKHFLNARTLFKTFTGNTSPYVTVPWKTKALLDIANTYYYAHQWQEAVGAWKELRATNPPHIEKLYVNIVDGLVQEGKPDEAIVEGHEGLMKMEQDAADNPKTYCALVSNLMVAHLSKGDPEKALKEYADDMKRAAVAPDGGLQAVVCLALLFGDKINDFQNNIVHTDEINQAHKDLLIGLYHLKMNRGSKGGGVPDEAVKRLRSYVSWPEDLGLTQKEIYRELSNDFQDRSWTHIKALMLLIQPLAQSSR